MEVDLRNLQDGLEGRQKLTLVSCREGDSPRKFSAADWRTRGKDLPTGKKVLVVVHGYNAVQAKVMNRYEQIGKQVYDTKLFDEVVGFLWPGSWSWGYLAAVLRTKDAAKRLLSVLRELKKLGNEVTVEGHSLGGRIALLAYGEKPELAAKWVLCAAACDRTWEIKPGNLVSYYSRRDPVLGGVYRVLNPLVPALGHSGAKKAVGWKQVDMTAKVDAHSGYMKDIVRMSAVEDYKVEDFPA